MPSPNWRKHRYLAIAAAILLAAGVGLPGPGPLTGRMTKYETRYYVIHTDLGLEGAHEAAVRMTAIVTEYRRRTKGFAGKITKKLPFYLYRNAWDYYAAGGRVGRTTP